LSLDICPPLLSCQIPHPRNTQSRPVTPCNAL
jgi:hypothetical protein